MSEVRRHEMVSRHHSLGRGTGEIEFVGVPKIWDVDCAWKFATDNFTDNFHVFWAHQSPGASWPPAELRRLRRSWTHGDVRQRTYPAFRARRTQRRARQGAWPSEVRCGRASKESLLPAQADIAMNHGYSAGTVWPNFHWLQLTSAADTESTAVGILNIRMEVPLSPTRTRMYSLVCDR